jgi:hypothetical protein
VARTFKDRSTRVDLIFTGPAVHDLRKLSGVGRNGRNGRNERLLLKKVIK